MLIKEFCENCEKTVDLNLKEIVNNKEIKGKKYKYIELIGYCKCCGEIVTSKVTVRVSAILIRPFCGFL